MLSPPYHPLSSPYSAKAFSFGVLVLHWHGQNIIDQTDIWYRCINVMCVYLPFVGLSRRKEICDGLLHESERHLFQFQQRKTILTRERDFHFIRSNRIALFIISLGDFAFILHFSQIYTYAHFVFVSLIVCPSIQLSICSIDLAVRSFQLLYKFHASKIIYKTKMSNSNICLRNGSLDMLSTDWPRLSQFISDLIEDCSLTKHNSKKSIL